LQGRGVHRSVGTTPTATLSPLGQIFRTVCSTPLGTGGRSSFHPARHRAAAKTQAPSMGAWHPTAGQPKPTSGPQRRADEVCETSSPVNNLIPGRLVRINIATLAAGEFATKRRSTITHRLLTSSDNISTRSLRLPSRAGRNGPTHHWASNSASRSNTPQSKRDDQC
jgi:hypothetical protein